MCFTIFQQFIEGRADSARLVIEAIVYMFVVTALTASAMAYLITRIGFFYRSRVHRRAPARPSTTSSTQTIPTVTVLVPSYQEDERVVRTTLLSAALQEHPYLRIVLLVDDPPEPTAAHAREICSSSARSLPGRDPGPARRALERFQARARRLRGLPEWRHPAHRRRRARRRRPTTGTPSQWLRDLAAAPGDRRPLRRASSPTTSWGRWPTTSRSSRGASTPPRPRAPPFPPDACVSSTGAWSPRSGPSSRASSASSTCRCSHAPNKAMNLNSYIGLMGGSYQEVATPLGHGPGGLRPPLGRR